MAEQQYYCKKCNRTMSADQFYGSSNLEKYPEGKLDTCKKCISMHVDNWKPETYVWILQECDVPYVPDEWSKLLESYARDPSKVTGMTILGRYLSKMKLKQYKDYRWKDTEFLQELADNKLEQAMKRQGYSAAEITMAQEQKRIIIPEEGFKEPVYETAEPIVEDYFAQQAGGDDMDFELTDEEKTYLRLKWGKAYKPDEWIELEKLYNEMMESYDIQTAGHKDTLKLICKTSLKANQLIDIGDIEGYQKMSKVYDTLMKSGKFTAQQNKAEKGEYVDSVSELIALCEKDGFIPRFYVDTPQDRVDRVIQDMEEYTRNLVLEEMHLGPLIEKAIRNNMNDAEHDDEDEEYDEDAELERSLYENDNDENTEEDYDEYYEQLEQLEHENEELFNLMSEGKV